VPGLFVTGTDTGVGKTVVSAAIAVALVARGVRTAACKPVLTGVDEPADGWPHDHEVLAAVTGMAPEDVSPVRFGPPVSPHLAAGRAGRALTAAGLAVPARRLGRAAEAVVVEGVGGLLVPLSERESVRDLAVALGLPVVVVARPGLGTINHTLLTVTAARDAGLDVRGVVLTPWPDEPGPIERSNLDTIARLGGVEVATLPYVAAPDPVLLADAARGLPVERWMAPDARPIAAAARPVPARAAA
jgi:dethiobiotin synthetase